MTGKVTLHGADYSVYVRIVRLTLAAKGVAYERVPVDIFAEGGPPLDHLKRHPFGKIPSFAHDGFMLFETAAITRYIDAAFEGPALTPAAPRDMARMAQAIGVLDAYAYRAMVWDVFVERTDPPGGDGRSDEGRIAAGLATAATCLEVFDRLIGDGEHLAGAATSLADLHAIPIFGYFARAPEGAQMIARHGPVARWWAAHGSRLETIC